VNDPNAPHIILNLVRVNDAWELRSLSFGSHFNTLRIFFGPQLPLPARQTDDRRIVVTFTVSMVAPARFGGSLSSWPSVRGPRSSKPTSLTWTRSSDALVFTPEIKIASPRYGSNHTHSDAYSRPALNSWSERKLCLSLCSAA